MFTRDAKWLNEEWVEAANARNNFIGTKVVIRPVTLAGQPTSPFKKGAPAWTGRHGSKTPSGATSAWKNPDSFSPISAEGSR